MIEIKFDHVVNNRTIVVHAEIENPEPENGINERDAFIVEVTTKRGAIYKITRNLEHKLQVAALEEYSSRHIKYGK